MYTLWVEWYSESKGYYWVARTSYGSLQRALWAMSPITAVAAKITNRDGTIMKTNEVPPKQRSARVQG